MAGVYITGLSPPCKNKESKPTLTGKLAYKQISCSPKTKMASLGGLHYGEKLNAKVQRNRQKCKFQST